MTTTRRKLKTGRADDHASTPPVISLLTDFGATDYFVAAMKGVILSVNPKAVLIDISHEIPPQDIQAAAFTLFASYRSFPPTTINLAVVDPGVGSARRPIIVKTEAGLFVGPDNGIFSYVLEDQRKYDIVHITAEKYFRDEVSTTFHGRDIFAPIAAKLSVGNRFEAFGPRISDPVLLESLKPLKHKKWLQGRVLHIDHFGNCITNLSRTDIGSDSQLRIKGQKIRTFKKFFSEENGSDGELFGIWGSAGFLEIAATNKSAAKLLHAKRGDEIKVVRL